MHKCLSGSQGDRMSPGGDGGDPILQNKVPCPQPLKYTQNAANTLASAVDPHQCQDKNGDFFKIDRGGWIHGSTLTEAWTQYKAVLYGPWQSYVNTRTYS